MNEQLRHLALNGYYYGSLPWRRGLNALRSARQQAPVSILFYHRVADRCPNPWTISTADFTKQVSWLQHHFDLVSLVEAQHRIRSGNPRPAVAITFDDGYADNCDHALPLLIERQIPCTYFVTTHNVFHGLSFPHDIQRGEPLPPNTLREVREMAAAGIDIGAHTRTHPDLGKLNSQSDLFDEIVTAGEELQQAIGHQVRYFAFPFGQHANLSSQAFQIAYQAGYDGVCSAYGGYNFPGDDAFHLQRFHGDPSMRRLQNWMSVDPRWRNLPRFAYSIRPPKLQPEAEPVA